MDCTLLQEALASKSYSNISNICDQIMFQVTTDGVAFKEQWPYAIHLLGYAYVDDIVPARFLWRSIPSSVKQTRQEVVAAWRIVEGLWTENRAGVFDAIRGFSWSPDARGLVDAFVEIYTKRMFEQLVSDYSTISIQQTALFLGMNEDDALNYVVDKGWTLDPSTGMLTVKKKEDDVVSEEKLYDPNPGRLDLEPDLGPDLEWRMERIKTIIEGCPMLNTKHNSGKLDQSMFCDFCGFI